MESRSFCFATFRGLFIHSSSTSTRQPIREEEGDEAVKYPVVTCEPPLLPSPPATPTSPIHGEKIQQAIHMSKHRSTHMPEPVFTLFAFIARQGVHISDLFRRPGNLNQMKAISSSLAIGDHVDWSAYNVYTVANVAKRFLLSVPGGLFGELNEAKLLASAVPIDQLTPSCPSTPATSKGSIRLPSKLMHTPGFLASESGITGATTTTPSPLVTDNTGFLSDFGLGPPSPNERAQMQLFIEILEGLPPACRELAVIIFGILHSMVRHAGYEVTTGCHSCATSESSRPSSLIAPVLSTSSSGTAPPIRILAEAVSKSVAGALLHTCPLSVHMVDRGAQVIQTLILRYSHLGTSITKDYTDLLMGQVWPQTSSTEKLAPMAKVVTIFIVPTRSPPKKGGLKLQKQKLKSKRKYYESSHKSIGLFAMASRLLCLTRRLGGGGKTTPEPGTVSLTSFPSSISSLPPPIPPFTVDPSPPPTSPRVERPRIPVLASIESVPVNTSTSATERETDQSSNEQLYTQAFIHSYIRRSRSRYRAVHRRQMDAMLRRTAWFLNNTSSNQGHHSSYQGGYAPQVIISFDDSHFLTPTTAAAAINAAGLVGVQTSTVSLLEMSTQSCSTSYLPLTVVSTNEMLRSSLQQGFYLTTMPAVSMTSIRSAPTCQVSPAAFPDTRRPSKNPSMDVSPRRTSDV